jgi:hypothetical protein
LKNIFDTAIRTRLEEGLPIPRPGASVPIEFATSACIDVHAELARDFTQKILHLEWAGISDASSLWDFHGEENNDTYCVKIRKVYGVDVSDIESANICEILKRIASFQETAEKHPDN